MYKCKYCGKEFEKHESLAAHLGRCKKKPNYYDSEEIKKRSEICKKSRESYIARHPEKFLKQDFIVKCNRCGKEYVVTVTKEQFDKGDYSHYCSRSCANVREHSEKTKNKIREGIYRHLENINKINNGEHLINPKLYKTYYCKVCGNPFTMLDKRDVTGRQYCSMKCKHKYLSEHTGGYRKGSGFGKSGWYKGIYCDSTWELAFVIYNIEHNIPIKRNKEKRKYIFEGQERTYLPDFIVNGEIIEIKGYVNEQWKAKLRSNPDIKVLYRKEMEPYIKYVEEKYGIHFEELYDNSKPIMNNK